MATLGGQVTAFNNIKQKQRAFATGLGGSGTNMTELDNFWGRIASVTLRSSASLNDCSWDYISKVSKAGLADALWSVGDRKAVSVNGSIYFDPDKNPTTSFNGTYYAYIVEFNHNASREGNNLTHFELGFSALSGGVPLAFSGAAFTTGSTTAGGWEAMYIRNTTLNGSSNSFAKALPQDLQPVLKTVIKYSDNMGNASGDNASAITETNDKLFIMSQFEITGSTSYANPNEATFNTQYQYYRNGNSKIKYQHNSQGSAIYYGTRTPRLDDSSSIRAVSSSGGGASAYAGEQTCFVPCYCV